MAYCSNCGKKNSDMAKFCGKCGAELFTSKAENIHKYNNESVFSIIAKVVIVVIILLLGITLFTEEVTLLQSIIIGGGLSLTFGVLCGKKELFTLAFGWGVLMLVINLVGYFTEFDTAYFWDIILWMGDLIVLYKFNINQENL
jgi:hypothetical protein